jgi:malonyl-CoA/methylmalonyl-CoA synthetase
LQPYSVSSWWRHLGQEGSPEELRSELALGSLAATAHTTARAHPSREAVRIDDRSLTHAELDDGARRVAAWLAANGAGPRTRVVLAAANSIEYVIGYLGILHSGAAVALVNPMLTSREIGLLVEDAEPVAALGDSDRVDELRSLGVGSVLALEGGGADSLSVTLDTLAPLDVRPPEHEEIAQLAFTSGTTGRPKPTPLTHGNLLATVRSIVGAWRLSGTDTLVHGLPLQHAHGLSALHVVLVTGCRAVFLREFEPERLCRALEDNHATVLFSVPAVYERLLAWGGLRRAKLDTLRLATSGSAPLSPVTSDSVFEELGRRALERYGCTETGFTLSNPYDGERRTGSVGFPLPGAEVAIVDDEGNDVEPGSVGEVAVRGPSVFSGYLGRDQDSQCFFDESWFRTGDLALADPADGYVSIVGRSKELIITGGLNVYPREVELVLESLPEVATAVVVGEPSTRWGEEVSAYLVPATGAQIDTEAVARAIEPVLASYKRPKRYQVVQEVPRNHMGKILRSEIGRGPQAAGFAGDDRTGPPVEGESRPFV